MDHLLISRNIWNNRAGQILYAIGPLARLHNFSTAVREPAARLAAHRGLTHRGTEREQVRLGSNQVAPDFRALAVVLFRLSNRNKSTGSSALEAP